MDLLKERVINLTEQNKLFNALYQNAEMGTSSIKKIYPKVQNSKLRNELRMQLSNYKNQTNMLTAQMRSQKLTPTPLPKMTKLMSSMGIAMKCAKDNSTENIAEMLIQGTNMGVIKINKALNKSNTAEPKIIQEAKNMLTREQQYIDNLKSYL